MQRLHNGDIIGYWAKPDRGTWDAVQHVPRVVQGWRRRGNLTALREGEGCLFVQFSCMRAAIVSKGARRALPITGKGGNPGFLTYSRTAGNGASGAGRSAESVQRSSSHPE